MEIYKLNLSLKEITDKEYLVTNGIGGYASSTISSMNTRRYHGLLVASMNPPAQRRVLLSKIDESIEIGNNKYDLFTNISNGYMTKGFNYLEKVEYDYYPKFIYEVNGVTIEKEVVMQHMKNTTCIKYTVKAADEDVILNLTPLVTNRNFHYLGLEPNLLSFQDVSNSFGFKDVHLSLEDVVLKFRASEELEYETYYNNMFQGMHYVREQERGFDNVEDLIVPGTFKCKVEKGLTKSFYILATTEKNLKDLEPEKLFDEEVYRLKKLVKKANLKLYSESIISNDLKLNEFKKDLVIAADNFIITRDDKKSIIAGYPWFLDWMRDTFISFEGLVLKTKRFDDAKEILSLAVRDIKEGLLPNGFGEIDNSPYYNSADASLLFFEAVQKYLDYTNDMKFVLNELYPKMVEIVDSYKFGINLCGNNIYLDSNNLLVSGSPEIQNTWMDAIVNGKVVTPRNGKAVEINALYYNAVCILSELTKEKDDYKKHATYVSLANNLKKAFNENFISSKGGLKDLTDDEKIRPNQLFAISLTYKVVTDVNVVKSIIEVCENKLYNRYGLKTLAKGEEFYVDNYNGGPEKRDSSYHQGITWPWLLIPYYYGVKYLSDIDSEDENIKRLKLLREKTYETYVKTLNQKPCINGISELNDSVFPYAPKGTITQAWSVAAILTTLFD